MNTFWQDLKHAPRALFRRPLIPIIAIVTLALAIGANTAIYTVLDATLLSPPPYPHPERLVAVWGVMPARDIQTFPAAPTNVETFRRESTLFEGFAGYTGGQNVLRIDQGESEIVASLAQEWNLFSLLGVKPFLGRDFTAEDAAFSAGDVPPGIEAPNNTFNPPKTIIIGYELWQSRFGGSPQVLGKRVQLNDLDVTIVGVMPRGFQLLVHGGVDPHPGIYAPLRLDMVNITPHNVFMTVIARLKPGVTMQQAGAEIDAISARIAAGSPILSTNKWHNRLVGLHEEMTLGIRGFVFILSAAVGLVLLIACANVTNLLLVRAAGLSRDSAIRTALGGSRRRIVQRSLVETGVIVAISTALGVALAWVSLPLLVAMQPQNIPQLQGIGIDATILGFTILVTTVVTFFAGIAPALSMSRLDLVEHLRERNALFESRSSRRWRSVLIVAEVAIAFTLLVGAGLMLRSYAELNRRDPGFDPSGVLTFAFNIPNARYATPQAQEALRREFARRVGALPGVQGVTGISSVPLTGANFGSRYAPDLATFDGGSARQAQYQITYPRYFETMRTPILSGREFTWADEDSGAAIAIVDDALAARAWPGQSPIGKTVYIRKATPEAVALQVVGVVRHQAARSLDEVPGETVYFTQATAEAIGFGGGGTSWVVRSGIEPTALTQQIGAALREIDPEIPIVAARPLREIVHEAAAPTRFAMTLIALFAGLALVLAVVGLYGLLAFRVRQRQPELGLRLTLGARRGQVFGMVVRQGLVLVAAGVGIGLALALASSSALRALLVDVAPTDPATYAAITALFVGIALVACMLPAWRATRVDPAVVLRED